MKTKAHNAAAGAAKVQRQPKAQKPEPTYDTGKAAVMYCGGFESEPAAELGPCGFITDNAHMYGEVVKAAQFYAIRKSGEDALGMKADCAFDRGIVFVFSGSHFTDQFFMRIAAAEPVLTFKEARDAYKNLKFISTALRGPEFVAYARRIIDIANPSVVIVHPLEYLVGEKLSKDRHALMRELGWLLPGSERYQSIHASAPDYHVDPDDPQDWWKKDGY